MQRMKLVACVTLASVILSRCISKPSVQKAPVIPPPAWMMQPPPDLLTPLSEIIGYSKNELHRQSKCRVILSKLLIIITRIIKLVDV
ncbi:hypothetical protein GWI85_11450 [Proteus sp. G4415]|nr:Rz1 family lipoprotein [Proteus mirabilis]NBN49973.1 hypothetical protein [Proteus sp. G4415]MBI6403098.1 Rz1 family lipoprotein [Proteus mirabilis]MCT0095585.1 Rz1 family lipoprotein [Proteus mirabilis]HEK0674103.1 Rz1 family lipoprotein [Proteus mirabilis]